MNRFIHWLIILGLIPFSIMPADPMPGLEDRFRLLQMENQQLSIPIDSLKAIVNLHRLKLESLKKQPVPDQDEIKRRLSEGIGISNQLKEKVKLYDRNNGQLQELKIQLERLCTHRIDSLTRLIQSGRYPASDSIKRQIMIYTEKRLEYSPIPVHLSIDLKKIRQIDSRQIHDSTEAAIASQYLGYAEHLLDSNLMILKRIRQDVRSYATLQQKTGEFLEGLDFYQPFAFSAPVSDKMVSDFDPRNYENNNSNIANQYQSIYTMIRQLNYQDPLQSGKLWNTIQSGNPGSLSPDSYLKLLDETIRLLEYYHGLIRDKQSIP
ncbi:MAG: hypothetical protein KBA26_15075 [Candidatus Delongbacteria bacterium]|nr:hypothetical protein [Candidatus Delongbacteria bacterium]